MITRIATKKQGWHADKDDSGDAPAGFPWIACLQLDGYSVTLDGRWFATEQDCLDWLRDEVAGRGMWPDA